MNGDLSLAQSLGGLRIANPDEEAVASPTLSPNSERTSSAAMPPPPLSSHSSGDTVTASTPAAGQEGLLPALSHQSSGQASDGLGFDPGSYSVKRVMSPPTSSSPRPPSIARSVESANRRSSHRQSMPLGHQAQQAMQYPTYSPTYSQAQVRVPGLQTTSTRPISGMYQQPNTSSSSGLASSQGSYRYRDEMGSSDGSGSGLARSGSRSARDVMGNVPARQGSRSYRQPGQQMNGGNGPLPPRRNSKRSRAPMSSGNQGYDNQEAPYTQEAEPQGQTPSRLIKKGVKDFNFGRTLGEGSYSTVLAATDRQNLKEYAIKVLDKRHIIKEKKVKYVNIERDTLNRLTEHPGIVRLYYTFQDERSLYFVLDLASGGELLGVLKKMGSFDIECTKFYGAEILDSIAYMHARGVIHRDLKPENVLLDRDMHVKITDFGTAKILADPGGNGNGNTAGSPLDGSDTDRAVSFVGTAEYVSPELLRDKNACKASDLWAFGCIIYQLFAGRPPFKGANEYLTFQKILALEYSFPEGFPPVARDLIERLLVLDPASRLPVEHIKNHRFFEGVQWGNGLWRQKAPRLKAYVAPAAEPIKLNGGNKSVGNLAAAGAAAALNQSGSNQPQSHANSHSNRPQLRGVTELPPPSQLDIDWSPVLIHDNERILKLGNLILYTGPQPSSPTSKNGDPGTPSEKPKFRSFFSGNVSKKRERLILITSSARLVVAAAGGNEKKTKMEVNLLASGTTWKSYVDSKGLTAWALDTRDKHLTFEDPRATTADPAGSKYSTQEWLESLEQARELAVAQSATGSYSGDSILNPMDGDINNSADSLGGDTVMPLPSPGDRHMLRQTLRKNGSFGGDDSSDPSKSRRRFSKRNSKSGLAAVF